MLTEYVRQNLSETIRQLYQDSNGVVHAITLDPQIEEAMTQALQANNQMSTSPTLGLAPEMVNKIIAGLSETIDEISIAGHLPTVICSAQVRPYFYRMIHTNFPMVNVISYTELPPETEIEISSSVKM